MIKPDTALYASDESAASVTEARDYIKRMELTKEDVKLVQREGQTLIISKRELWG